MAYQAKHKLNLYVKLKKTNSISVTGFDLFQYLMRAGSSEMEMQQLNVCYSSKKKSPLLKKAKPENFSFNIITKPPSKDIFNPAFRDKRIQELDII